MKKNSSLSKEDLVHVLTNYFHRTTLVNKLDKERVTVDFGLEFRKDKNKKKIQNLVIVEVKQEGSLIKSKMIGLLKKNRIYRTSFSKYTTGIALLNDKVKYNNFKSKLSYLNKIHQNTQNENIWNPNN